MTHLLNLGYLGPSTHFLILPFLFRRLRAILPLPCAPADGSPVTPPCNDEGVGQRDGEGLVDVAAPREGNLLPLVNVQS